MHKFIIVSVLSLFTICYSSAQDSIRITNQTVKFDSACGLATISLSVAETYLLQIRTNKGLLLRKIIIIK